jgi:hypothetical protein
MRSSLSLKLKNKDLSSSLVFSIAIIHKLVNKSIRIGYDKVPYLLRLPTGLRVAVF